MKNSFVVFCQTETMQQKLALFPLNLAAFPDQKLNLHIFEPRYKQLINDCKTNGIRFGIPPFIKGQEMVIGTEMELISIEKVYDNGSMDVRTIGRKIFKIKRYYSKYKDREYSGGEIEYLVNNTTPAIDQYPKIISLIEELYNVFGIQKEIPTLDKNFTSYTVAHNVGFSLDQEVDFLHLDNEGDRAAMLIEQLAYFIPKAKELESIRKKIQMNGHFRTIIPPNVEEL